jgi:multisubunit Na+/H+ antiporter MnhE subunit
MAQHAEIKRSAASLIGGIVIAIFVFVLWLLVLGSHGPVEIASGAIVAVLLGLWVRIADL